MDEKKEEGFLKMLGLKATKKILEYLDENETAQYKQLQQFVNTHTLNTRMRELLDFDLVQHHLVREDVRREWYEPTEKGRKVLQYLREMVHVIDE
ncbi:MAG: winged helix-turn-helix transcriptional regulator [Theionarchaea archaeon]|nr:winged helix-turn-helix transcriptional regulator [Theionarchaea archaeon]